MEEKACMHLCMGLERPDVMIKVVLKFVLRSHSILQIFLDYVLFLKRLAIESNVKAQENKEKTLQVHHVNGVLQVS